MRELDDYGAFKNRNRQLRTGLGGLGYYLKKEELC